MRTFEFIDPDAQLGSESFRAVERFLLETGRTRIGWHYLTDLVWIHRQVQDWPRGMDILDLGGGSGPLQFLLAEMGFQVVNVDLLFPRPPLAHRFRYGTRFETFPSFRTTAYADHIAPSKSLKRWIKNSLVYRAWKSLGYRSRHERWRRSVGLGDIPVGRLRRVQGNLCAMPELPAGTFDAVVSLSALEHVPLPQLPVALKEVERVLKPGGRWAVTTSGTEQPRTWLHEPSMGLCFCSEDLQSLFDAAPLGDQDPRAVLEKYRGCAYLKDHLAPFYRKSDRYGMPRGLWDPKYIPVGIGGS